MNLVGVAYSISIWVLPVLFAITLHEAAHGWVAWRLGDDTAYQLGRVTFNPIKHIDPFGTIVLPAVLLIASNGTMAFGAAKPVPVNFRRLPQPRRDTMLVAVAGPATNLGLAILSALLLRAIPLLSGDVQLWVALNLINSVVINLLLCLFNMIPLPPLDGGRVAVAILPRSPALALARLERWGIWIILFALFGLPWLGRSIGMDLNIFWWIIVRPMYALKDVIGAMVGVNIPF